MATRFEEFGTWADVLAYASAGGHLAYRSPLDASPHYVRVVKVFKNGKVRIDPLSLRADNFTADSGHLYRCFRPVHSGPPCDHVRKIALPFAGTVCGACGRSMPK